MSKVIALIAALALFAALPAVASAQTEPQGGGDTVSSGNTQDSDIDQGAQGGGDAIGGGGDDDGHGGDAAGGDGNAGNQAAVCQQNAGGDANCAIDQSQRFGDVDGDGDNDGDHDGDGDVDHVSGHGGGHGGGVGGGGVQSVTLARTGFDAWVLALLGGVSLAGGLGLLAAQRRGRLSA